VKSIVQPDGSPISAAVPLKVKICSCLIVGVTVSNPPKGMNVHLLCSFVLSR